MSRATSEHTSERRGPAPWRVPVAVEEIAETGAQFDLAADADIRAAVAQIAGLRELPRFEANFVLTRHGNGGLKVAGRISATVGQTCVVTLEPLASEVAEAVDLVFVPRPASAADEAGAPQNADAETEPLVDGIVDLGTLATEFLILGLDPYPRKPGAVFAPSQEEAPNESPFASLAALKPSRNNP
jgi:uncharacterized metal-binding protein YceD (DUF177 family)